MIHNVHRLPGVIGVEHDFRRTFHRVQLHLALGAKHGGYALAPCALRIQLPPLCEQEPADLMKDVN